MKTTWLEPVKPFGDQLKTESAPPVSHWGLFRNHRMVMENRAGCQNRGGKEQKPGEPPAVFRRTSALSAGAGRTEREGK